jgi:hypothetical protein
MTLTPTAGHNGLIYVSGAELEGANAWSLDIPEASIEYASMGDTWKSRVAGQKGVTGSVAAWLDTAAKKLFEAATATVAVATLIYPDRNDTSTYYSFDAFFGMSNNADLNSMVGQTANFAVDGEVAATGWT